jgi:hypothetical protein
MIVLTNLLDQDSTLYPVMDSLTGLVFSGMPVAVGIAVLRYRLYDIDVIINRTLVYGSLTATLVATYFGGIVLLQRLFVVLTGNHNMMSCSCDRAGILKYGQ